MGHKVESPRRAHAARVPHQVLPQGAKTRVYLPTYKTLHYVRTVWALRAHCVHGFPL